MFDIILPAVVLAFIIDMILGDPRWIYHPIRLVGNLISICEKGIRKIVSKTKKGERLGGVLLVILVAGISTAIPTIILVICYKINVYLAFAVQTFFCWQLFAMKSLKVESMKVYHAIKTGDIEKARYAVSMIVGRDTASLDFTGVTKAAVETVAENSSDGVIAPMLFMVIAGASGGFLYKSINTMDSMVGYKNDRYRYFGTAAAKLDDIVNFIPARLAGIFMIMASYLTGFDGKNAAKIFIRDRKKHASPNSAQTEAVMAGALDIQLAGDAYYFGKLHKKQTIGDPIRPVEPEDIPRSNKLLYGTSILSLVLMGAVRLIVVLLLMK